MGCCCLLRARPRGAQRRIEASTMLLHVGLVLCIVSYTSTVFVFCCLLLLNKHIKVVLAASPLHSTPRFRRSGSINLAPGSQCGPFPENYWPRLSTRELLLATIV